MNKFLPEDFIERQIKAHDEKWVDRFIYGSFDYADGAVYPTFRSAICEPFPIPDYFPRIVAMDFGGKDPTAMAFLAIDPDKGDVYFYDEYYETSLNVKEHSERIKPKLDAIPQGMMLFPLRADPSGRAKQISTQRSLFDHYAEYGIYCTEANNAINAGLAKVATYIERGKLKVFSTCTWAIKEGSEYAYDLDKTNDKPVGGFDHCLTGDTLVHTVEGLVPIKDLVGKEGQLYCYDEQTNQKTISDFFDVRKTRENAEILQIETDTGIIKCTPDHLVLTTEGWKEAGQLNENSLIISIDDKYKYFNGSVYTRDEKTGYYLSSNKVGNKRKRLHRVVWEFYNGNIPNGFDVHHIDHDKGNNIIENLELISKSEHSKRHGKELTTEQRQKLRTNLVNKAMPKAKAWHSSPEGLAWHKEHYLEISKSIKEKEYVCENCKKTYYKKPFGKNRFCSNACKSAYRRNNKLDNVDIVCMNCGGVFSGNKYRKRKYCSKECRKSAKNNQSE